MKIINDKNQTHNTPLLDRYCIRFEKKDDKSSHLVYHVELETCLGTKYLIITGIEA